MNPKALILVDLNYDFFPNGALGVEGANALIGVWNDLIEAPEYQLTVATQDWHPDDHCSFEQWPAHCVAGSAGAELHPAIAWEQVDVVIRKGFDAHCDSYSGFWNAAGQSNGLPEILKSLGILAVDIAGLATDYCVKATAIHAAKDAQLKTRVLMDACRGVGLKENDIAEAWKAMTEAGVELV